MEKFEEMIRVIIVKCYGSCLDGMKVRIYMGIFSYGIKVFSQHALIESCNEGRRFNTR